MEWIVNSWEIESFVENFKVMELETYGTERYLHLAALYSSIIFNLKRFISK